MPESANRKTDNKQAKSQPMRFKEFIAKPLLAAAGIAIPPGRPALSPEQAFEVAASLGPALVKAQITAGGRGRAGAVLEAPTPRAAASAAESLLGQDFAGETVEEVLIEAKIPVARELFAAIITHPESKGPLLLFSTAGGMAIEQITARHPETLAHLPIDIRDGIDDELLAHIFQALGIEQASDALVELCLKLFDAYRVNDAELIEINPLALTPEGLLVALDCRFVLDDAAIPRRPELAALGSPPALTPLETRAADAGLELIDLADPEGDIAVLAPGAGLGLAAIDALRHLGGRPALLCLFEEARTRPALETVFARPGLKALLIQLGAGAPEAERIAAVLATLQPKIPVILALPATEDARRAAIREKLGIEPEPSLDQAARTAAALAA
jgi:succinyl-CoA synthetase beta subunit